MKKLLKQIITMLLASCIMITGDSLSGAVAVNAAARPVIRPVQLAVMNNSCMLGKGGQGNTVCPVRVEKHYKGMRLEIQ